MKNLKFTLILSLVIVLAVVFPVYTFATDVNTDTSADSAVSEPTEGDTGDSTTEQPVEGDTNAEEPTDTSESGTTTDNTEGTTSEEETADDTTEDTTTEEGSTDIDVVGNYFESNTEINFDKIVDGNIFLFGNDITVNGSVNGDAVIFGDNVTFTQDTQILGNVYLVANNFTQNGAIYSLLAFVTNYTCEYDGMSSLDLRVFADNINFSGYTNRSTYFYANNIELTDDAFIIGNLVYNENANLTLGENSTIYGQQIPDDLFSILISADTSNLVINHIISIAMLLGAVLFILLMITFFKPNTFSKVVKFKVSTTLKALGVGILSFIVLTILSTILLLSTIFTTVGFIVLMLFIIACMLGVPVTILTLASILYNKFNTNKSKLFVLLYTILVTLIYYALTIIPVAGFIINFIISISGLGLITLWLFRIRKNNKVYTVKATEEAQKTLSESTEKKEPVKKDEDTKKEDKKNIDKEVSSKKDDKKEDF